MFMLNGSFKDIKKILAVALPSAGKYTLDTIQTLVDLIILGNISHSYLTVVGIALQIILFFSAFGMVFSVGTNYTISRLKGANDLNSIKKFMFCIVLISSVIGVIIGFLTYISSYDIYRLLGAKGDSLIYGEKYMQIMAFAIIAIFLDDIFFNAFNGVKNSKITLKIKIVTIVFNIILTLILVYGTPITKALGFIGAPIATAISMYLSVFIYLFIIIFKNTDIKIKTGYSPLAKEAIYIGGVSSLERILTFFTIVVINPVVAQYGEAVLAGYQTGLRIESIAFMPGLGFMIATMSIAGNHVGAKNTKAVYKDVILINKLSAYFMGAVSIVAIIFAREIASIFTNHEETIRQTVIYTYFVFPSLLPLSYMFIFGSALRALGDVKTLAISNISSTYLFRVAPLLIITYFTNLSIIWVYIVVSLETLFRGWLFYYLFVNHKMIKKIRFV